MTLLGMIRNCIYIILSLSLILVSCSPGNNEKSIADSNQDKIDMEKLKAELQQQKKEPIAISSATPEQLAKARELIENSNEDEVDKVDARKKFKMLCATCHGIKGNMNVNGAKDLTISNTSLEERVAQVYFGKGLMTPYKGVLTDNEIVAVCKFVETLRK